MTSDKASENSREFADQALGAAALLCMITVFAAAPYFYLQAVRRFRVEGRLPPAQDFGPLSELAVSPTELGIRVVAIEVILPALVFFLVYVLAARAVQFFCEFAELIFQLAAGNEQELVVKGHRHLVARVILFPAYFLYGVLLLLGAIVIALFRIVWR